MCIAVVLISLHNKQADILVNTYLKPSNITNAIVLVILTSDTNYKHLML